MGGIMIKKLIVLLAIIGAGLVGLMLYLHLTGRVSLTGKLTPNQAIERAALALIGKPQYDGNVPVTVTHSNGEYKVRFELPVPGGDAGETYFSFAVIDDSSGEALEVGVEEKQQPQMQLIDRPTPLREEVDEVEELKKSMKHLNR